MNLAISGFGSASAGTSVKAGNVVKVIVAQLSGISGGSVVVECTLPNGQTITQHLVRSAGKSVSFNVSSAGSVTVAAKHGSSGTDHGMATTMTVNTNA